MAMAGRFFSALVFLLSTVAMGLAAASVANGRSHEGHMGGKAHKMLGHYFPYDSYVDSWDAYADNIAAASPGAVTLIFGMIAFIVGPDPDEDRVFGRLAFYISLGWFALIGYQTYFYIVAGTDGPNNLGDVLDFCKIGGGSQFTSTVQQNIYSFECSIIRIEFVKFIFIITSVVSLNLLSSALSPAPVPVPQPIYDWVPGLVRVPRY